MFNDFKSWVSPDVENNAFLSLIPHFNFVKNLSKFNKKETCTDGHDTDEPLM